MGTFGGEVTSAKLFTGKNKNNIDEDGLLSESIFGPIKNYECRCGKLFNQTLSGGQVCPKCGVLCDSNELRLRTFGYIKLIFPVIKPTKLKFIKKIVPNSHKHLLDPKKADALLATSRYLGVSSDGEILRIFDTMVPQSPDWYIIPIRITGLYSFILSLKYVAEVFQLQVARTLFEKGYITDVIKVLPPDIRPIIKSHEKKGTIHYAEVNKKYISLINLNKSHSIEKQIKPQKEKDWFDKLMFDCRNGIEDELVDPTIQEWDRWAARYQYYVNQVYEVIFAGISGKTGYIRSSILGKTIEFSGRAVITIDPSMEAYKIKVSKKMLYKLWYPYYLNWLSKNYEDDYALLFDQHFVVKEYEDDKELFGRFLEDFVSGKMDQEEPKKGVPNSVKDLIERRRVEYNFEEETDEL